MKTIGRSQKNTCEARKDGRVRVSYERFWFLLSSCGWYEKGVRELADVRPVKK